MSTILVLSISFTVIIGLFALFLAARLKKQLAKTIDETLQPGSLTLVVHASTDWKHTLLKGSKINTALSYIQSALDLGFKEGRGYCTQEISNLHIVDMYHPSGAFAILYWHAQTAGWWEVYHSGICFSNNPGGKAGVERDGYTYEYVKEGDLDGIWIKAQAYSLSEQGVVAHQNSNPQKNITPNAENFAQWFA